ncbi:Fc receptor-like protein 1 isoform X1 [Trichechus manatus latirostris]|uniref:Fc receptor-like protein 1 isoform X1 n=1 Tax=Trichechus manatus latirostris TaxID=127582 RepID=A0A2Y9QDT9_TRIMA|nr:Fc receptor-like protein 1 isoform X1 [Trichechus manatus latirostris]
MLLRLLLLICAPLCEPTELFLTASPAHPIEGSSVTLTCAIQLPLQTTDSQLQYRFVRNGWPLRLAWSSSPKLQIPSMWRGNSGLYWCEAKPVKAGVIKSKMLQINVQRVPVSDVNLEARPPGGQVTEGKMLVLVCSVTEGTGNITFFWYKGAMGLKLGTKTQSSLTAEFEILTARESDAEQYYCAADNGYGPSLSELVSITVRIPVSHPVLTIRATGAQAVAGDTVELHCEVQRGSPPILYRFYHEDIILGNSSAPSSGGASFNLTAEHSGNYSCEADNGLGTQHSEAVPLNITVPTKNRREFITTGVIEGLLGALGPFTIVLLFCYWLKRKIAYMPFPQRDFTWPPSLRLFSFIILHQRTKFLASCSITAGKQSASDPLRSPPSPVPQEITYLNSPTPVPLQPVYENVNLVSGDDIYSLVYCSQQEWKAAAERPRTPTEDEVSLDIYSKLKQASDSDGDYEDAM